MARHGNHHYEVGDMEMGHLPHRRPMGMDPNYRGGRYGGQRFEEQEDRAPYGRYRAQHAGELRTQGGSHGRYTGAGMLRDPGPSRPSGPEGPPPPRGPVGRGVPASRPPGYEGYDRGYGFQREPRRREREEFRYDHDYRRRGAPPWRFGPSRDARGRFRGFDASRPLRYDQAFNRYGGYGSSGFSEGYLGSGF